MIKVVKFGGSSLADATQFKKVKAIIDADDSRRYVIPSAPGRRFDADSKVTDMLYQYYDQVIADLDSSEIKKRIKRRYEDIIHGLDIDFDLDKELAIIDEQFHQGANQDYAASRGEYLNGLIMAKYLKIPFVDAKDVICFDEKGIFLPEKTNQTLQLVLTNYKRAIIPGFYGAMPNGMIKTFSRGGSDISGSLVARAMKADLYENWTDVSGFLLADPRIVDNPVPIGIITYKELHELSSMGACVLHEDAIFPVKKEGIPINIKNTNCPDDLGTMIVDNTTLKPNHKITGIAGKKGYYKVKISNPQSSDNLGCEMLEFLENHNIPFDCFPSDRDAISILMQQDSLKSVQQSFVSNLNSNLNVDLEALDSHIALVAVGRREMKSKRGFARRICRTLNQANISIKAMSQGSEELMMLVGVRDEDFEEAVRVIYDYFIDVNGSCTNVTVL